MSLDVDRDITKALGTYAEENEMSFLDALSFLSKRETLTIGAELLGLDPTPLVTSKLGDLLSRYHYTVPKLMDKPRRELASLNLGASEDDDTQKSRRHYELCGQVLSYMQDTLHMTPGEIRKTITDINHKMHEGVPAGIRGW